MSAAERALAVRELWITHERLDDEVIAINLETGVYYAMVGSAADIWSAFQPSGTVDRAVEILAERYDTSTASIRDDVVSFVKRLEDAGLLVTADGDLGTKDLPARASNGPWAVPELEEYHDMADLVLLDPIHQVDESGWPHLPEPPT